MKNSKVLSKKDRVFSKDIETVSNLIKTDQVYSVVNKVNKVSRVPIKRLFSN